MLDMLAMAIANAQSALAIAAYKRSKDDTDTTQVHADLRQAASDVAAALKEAGA